MEIKWLTRTLVAAAVGLLAASSAPATEPCGDFGECKTLIEINATDGDIGFHFLADGDDLYLLRLFDAEGTKTVEEQAKGPLAEQTLTESFAESAEPLCWDDPDADPDEEIVTVPEFLERWAAGTYLFEGSAKNGEKSEGEDELTHELPAAPADLDFDGSVISWAPGDDLGRCGTAEELAALVEDGTLPVHPQDVVVAAWEVVLEPRLDGDLNFTIRLPGSLSPREVTVPADYLASLPPDTTVKIEVGAIGGDDNATFSEVGGFCVNETTEGCEE
jgi:hypothetical protein